MASWSTDWNGKTMSVIEEEIKSVVDGKVGFIGSKPNVDDVLVFNSTDGNNKTSWIAEAKSITKLLGDQGVTTTTITNEDGTEKQSLTLNADEIILSANEGGTIKFETPANFTDEANFSSAVKAPNSTLTVKDITFTGAISSSTGSGTFKTLTSTDLIGENFYIGAGKGTDGANKIKLTPTSFETTTLKAATLETTGTATIKGTATIEGAATIKNNTTITGILTVGSYSTFDPNNHTWDLKYRPLRISSTEPTSGTPGTLVAVIKSSS